MPWGFTLRSQNANTGAHDRPQTQSQRTSPSVEDADASISPVVNLVSSQRGVAVRLDPHPGHGVVKDLIVLDEAQACKVKDEG